MTKKSNKGFDYEDKIIKKLKEKKLIPQDKKKTGGSDKADIIIDFKGKQIISCKKKGPKNIGPFNLIT